MRLPPGPIRLKDQFGRLTAAELTSWYAFADAHPVGGTERLDYRADGRRSLAEICRLVELETGTCDRTFALGYFQLLNRLELVKGA